MNNIVTESGIRMKLVRLIKMCLTETYSRVRLSKNWSDMFTIKNGLEQGDAVSPLLFNFAFVYAIRGGSDKPGWFEIECYTSAVDLC